MYEIFERLLKERGVKASTVAKATGIASSVFTDWKKGRYTPKVDKMQKIADYFGVSVAYLQGIDEQERDFNKKFFDRTAFESYLSQIGWNVSRTNYEKDMPCDRCGKELELSDTDKKFYPFGKAEKLCEHCSKEDNHYVISNGVISANLSDDDFNAFENKIRDECVSVIRAMILKSMEDEEPQLLAAHERKDMNDADEALRKADIDML